MSPAAEHQVTGRRFLAEPAPVARRGPLPEHQRALMPIHLVDHHDEHLTCCALFGDHVPGRITEDLAEVTCVHCVQEGPVGAYVVLPDGHVVERRNSALDGHHFAVAASRASAGPAAYRLIGWMSDIADARATRERQLLRGRTAYVLPVLYAR